MKHYWSAEEDAILREHYAKLGSKKVCELTGRTKKAVNMRAMFLKLKCPALDRPEWTTAEDEVIRQLYSSEGSKVCAERLGRTQIAVRGRAVVLGVKGCRCLAGQTRRLNNMLKAQAKSNENRNRVVRVPKVDARTKIPAREWIGPEIITSDTKVTIAPPFVDTRFLVTDAPRVVSSADCREWARR